MILEGRYVQIMYTLYPFSTKSLEHFGGLATPPCKFSGALVRKKLFLFSRLHTSASSARF
jgi:hypothetical protein